MNTNGVMEEIRSLLSRGMSSTETIALGYKPSTVYKAQRQLRRSPSVSGPPVTTQVLVTNMASEDSTRLREEIQALQEQVASLVEITAERDALREELDSALSQIDELVMEASQVQMLRERLAEVEPESKATGELRHQVEDLMSRLGHSRAAMAREAQQWQATLQQEQRAHREAEDLVSHQNTEINRLKSENQRLAQQLEDFPGHITPKLWALIQPMQQEVEALRQLQVWAGHPCSKCGKPTSGVTSRELAAKLLRESGYGHGDCVKKRPW